jgi:hypothetical protein
MNALFSLEAKLNCYTNAITRSSSEASFYLPQVTTGTIAINPGLLCAILVIQIIRVILQFVTLPLLFTLALATGC